MGIIYYLNVSMCMGNSIVLRTQAKAGMAASIWAVHAYKYIYINNIAVQCIVFTPFATKSGSQ